MIFRGLTVGSFYFYACPMSWHHLNLRVKKKKVVSARTEDDPQWVFWAWPES